ncbi:hypothetical protein [Stutzerimonas kirkiae]|nr:hypothetical protein [Stutzerimonas kirkiae]
MTVPIICRTYRKPANQCDCFRCRPLITYSSLKNNDLRLRD